MIGDADTDLGEPGLRVEGVGLQNAGVTGQMPLGILPRTIARGLEQRRLEGPCRQMAGRRGRTSLPGQSPSGLGGGPSRRSAGQDMALDQSVQSKRRGAGADLVGERQQAGVDSFAGAAIALPIERLMLSTHLKQTSGSDAVVPSRPILPHPG